MQDEVKQDQTSPEHTSHIDTTKSAFILGQNNLTQKSQKPVWCYISASMHVYTTAPTLTVVRQQQQQRKKNLSNYPINGRIPEFSVFPLLHLALFQNKDKFTNYFIINLTML
jgi:hypothetical protein